MAHEWWGYWDCIYPSFVYVSLKAFGVVGLDTYTWGMKDFHKCWSGSLAKRRFCLGPTGVTNCTPLSALSFWVSLFPGTRGYNKGKFYTVATWVMGLLSRVGGLCKLGVVWAAWFTEVDAWKHLVISEHRVCSWEAQDWFSCSTILKRPKLYLSALPTPACGLPFKCLQNGWCSYEQHDCFQR